MIGYRAGDSLLHRAHPYTPLALAGAVLCLVFAARTTEQVGGLVIAGILLAVAAGVLTDATRAALVLALPTWALLFVLHGVLGPEPFRSIGPVRVSEAGFDRAVVLGGRIVAIVFAFLAMLGSVSPSRLVAAMAARGVPFSLTYLIVSTLTLVPRMRDRARGILEAQQCRGLRLGGSPVARLRALGPLVLPLVLGALAEVDEQVMALDTRGAGSGLRRTPLRPPADNEFEWLLRWMCLIVVAAVWVTRARELMR